LVVTSSPSLDAHLRRIVRVLAGAGVRSRLEVGTRSGHLAGCTANRDRGWTSQRARQLVWSLADRATAARFLIPDRDSKFEPRS
jgi:hypothetical protein